MLSYLAHHPGEHGVRAIAAELGLGASTTFRLLDALVRAGFARRDEQSGKYAIGIQAVQVGLAAMAGFDLTVVGRRYLQVITAETGETSFLASLDEGEMVYLLKEEGKHAIRTTAVLGTRRPVHCTALGKAVLASVPFSEAEAIVQAKGLRAYTAQTITEREVLWEELATIRLRGYAVDREEIEEGLVCIAAPIHDHSRRVVAALSMAGPVGRVLPHEERFGRRMMMTAQEASQALGYLPPAAPAVPT